MRSKLALPALLTSTFVVLVVAPGAAAGDTTCTATLTGMHDNVVVPPGQTCILNAATVRGNVKALQDSRLRVAAGSNVRGNVEGDKADIVQVSNSTVRENISIKEGGPAAAPALGFQFCQLGTNPPNPPTPCEALVINSTIEDGNIQIEKMHGDTLVRSNGLLSMSPIGGNVLIYENFVPAGQAFSIDSNSVSQNVQVFKNKGPVGKIVGANTVGENLQCFENDPPVFSFLNVARQAQGQCTAAPLPMSFGFSVPAVRFG
jgi:hypothetical protein